MRRKNLVLRRVVGLFYCTGFAFLCGCVTLPKPGTGPAAAATAAGVAAPDRPADTRLSRTFGHETGQHPMVSGFRMISAGVDGLLIRVELIDNADSSLDLQYYIFRSDDTGKLIQNALLRAADRGVHVRIITDDGETVAGDEKLLLLAAHPNIEVRVFNPFEYRGHNRVLRAADFLFHKSRLDYRMHNKLLVADRTVAITGGRNIGDQYFQIDPESQFGDDDLLVVGPVVGRSADEFATYWNSGQVVPANRLAHIDPDRLAKYRADLALPPPTKIGVYAADFRKRIASREPLHTILSEPSALTWASATLLYDTPNKREVKQGDQFGRLMYGPVAERIALVNSEMLMITPYFVPVPGEIRLLTEQRERHVRTRILTNSLMAAPDLAAHAGYMHHRPTLLKSGVQLHEIRSDLGSTRGSGESKKLVRYGTFALHAKIFVFDGTALFVGSMNMDQRSVRLNTEMGLIIESGSLAAEVASRFNKLTRPENAYEVLLRENPPHGISRLIWKTREDGTDVEYRSEPARSLWQKIKVHVLSWLPLDPEL